MLPKRNDVPTAHVPPSAHKVSTGVCVGPGSSVITRPRNVLTPQPWQKSVPRSTSWYGMHPPPSGGRSRSSSVAVLVSPPGSMMSLPRCGSRELRSHYRHSNPIYGGGLAPSGSCPIPLSSDEELPSIAGETAFPFQDRISYLEERIRKLENKLSHQGLPDDSADGSSISEDFDRSTSSIAKEYNMRKCQIELERTKLKSEAWKTAYNKVKEEIKERKLRESAITEKYHKTKSTAKELLRAAEARNDALSLCLEEKEADVALKDQEITRLRRKLAEMESKMANSENWVRSAGSTFLRRGSSVDEATNSRLHDQTMSEIAKARYKCDCLKVMATQLVSGKHDFNINAILGKSGASSMSESEAEDSPPNSRGGSLSSSQSPESQAQDVFVKVRDLHNELAKLHSLAQNKAAEDMGQNMCNVQ